MLHVIQKILEGMKLMLLAVESRNFLEEYVDDVEGSRSYEENSEY